MLPGFPIPLSTRNLQGPQVIGVRNFGQSNATSGTRSVSVAYPTGTQVGDLVFALATCAGNAVYDPSNPRVLIAPEGWAPITSDGNARGEQTFSRSISWSTLMRVAQSGDGSFTFQASRSNRINVSLITVRGAALPLNAATHSASIAGGTLSGLTVTIKQALLVLFGGFANTSSIEPTVTGPGTATELVSYTQASGHNGGSRNWIGVEENPATGATGSRAWTENTEANVLGMVAIAPGEPGAWLYDRATPDTGSWVVPDGVTSVNILCIGSGGGSFPGFANGAGGGGACAYSNGVPVTPGEELTIQKGGQMYWNSSGGGTSFVKRGSTTLVSAAPGLPGTPDPAVGSGGLATNCIGDTRISGTGGYGPDNFGGSAGAPYGYRLSNAGSAGIGPAAITSTAFQPVAGGFGAGAPQSPSASLPGSSGLVLITWGINRGFGGPFI